MAQCCQKWNLCGKAVPIQFLICDQCKSCICACQGVNQFFFFINVLGSRASMFTFKSSSIEEDVPEKADDGTIDKEMEDLAAIMAEKILQVAFKMMQSYIH